MSSLATLAVMPDVVLALAAAAVKAACEIWLKDEAFVSEAPGPARST